MSPLQGYDSFGFNVDTNNNITYREWAPNAVRASLIGDFSETRLTSERIIFLSVVLC